MALGAFGLAEVLGLDAGAADPGRWRDRGVAQRVRHDHPGRDGRREGLAVERPKWALHLEALDVACGPVVEDHEAEDVVGRLGGGERRSGLGRLGDECALVKRTKTGSACYSMMIPGRLEMQLPDQWDVRSQTPSPAPDTPPPTSPSPPRTPAAARAAAPPPPPRPPSPRARCRPSAGPRTSAGGACRARTRRARRRGRGRGRPSSRRSRGPGGAGAARRTRGGGRRGPGRGGGPSWRRRRGTGGFGGGRSGWGRGGRRRRSGRAAKRLVDVSVS